VKISSDQNSYVGRGVNTDIINASAQAYLDAVSKLMEKESADPAAFQKVL
jgi:hypothetical protein